MTFDNFEEFKAYIDEGLKSGRIRFSRELSELDLALSFAMQCGYELKTGRGEEPIFTPDEIFQLLNVFCGEATVNRLLPPEGEDDE